MSIDAILGTCVLRSIVDMSTTWLAGITMTVAYIFNSVDAMVAATIVLFPSLIIWTLWLGRIHRTGLVAQNNSFITAVAPAVLAAKAIMDRKLGAIGLIPPNQHVNSTTLIAYLTHQASIKYWQE